MNNIVDKAIKEFMVQSVSSTKNESNLQKEQNPVGKLIKITPAIKSTTIFNKANTSSSNLKPVLELINSAGILRELIIISSFTFNIGIVIDSKKYFTNISAQDSFDDVADYSDIITSLINPAEKYITGLNDISFSNNILITTDIGSNQKVDNLLLIYDVFEGVY